MNCNLLRVFDTPHKAHCSRLPFHFTGGGGCSKHNSSYKASGAFLLSSGPSLFSPAPASESCTKLTPFLSLPSSCLLTGPPSEAETLPLGLTGPRKSAWPTILHYNNLHCIISKQNSISKRTEPPAVHWFASECFDDLKCLIFLENVLTAETWRTSRVRPLSHKLPSGLLFVHLHLKVVMHVFSQASVFIHITSHSLRNKVPNRAKQRTQKEKMKKMIRTKSINHFMYKLLSRRHIYDLNMILKYGRWYNQF